MKIKIIAATDLKRNTAELLNLVAYGDVTAIVERHGEPLVKMIPIKTRLEKKSLTLKEKIEKTFGSIPDFPDVTKYRRSRKREIKW